MSTITDCGVLIGRLLLKLARGQPLTPGELAAAAIANGRMVKWDIDRESGLRRKKLAQAVRDAECRRVEALLRLARTGDEFKSATDSTMWIAGRTGLPWTRVRGYLAEIRARSKVTNTVKHSSHQQGVPNVRRRNRRGSVGNNPARF